MTAVRDGVNSDQRRVDHFVEQQIGKSASSPPTDRSTKNGTFHRCVADPFDCAIHFIAKTFCCRRATAAIPNPCLAILAGGEMMKYDDRVHQVCSGFVVQYRPRDLCRRPSRKIGPAPLQLLGHIVGFQVVGFRRQTIQQFFDKKQLLFLL